MIKYTSHIVFAALWCRVAWVAATGEAPALFPAFLLLSSALFIGGIALALFADLAHLTYSKPALSIPPGLVAPASGIAVAGIAVAFATNVCVNCAILLGLLKYGLFSVTLEIAFGFTLHSLYIVNNCRYHLRINKDHRRTFANRLGGKSLDWHFVWAMGLNQCGLLVRLYPRVLMYTVLVWWNGHPNTTTDELSPLTAIFLHCVRVVPCMLIMFAPALNPGIIQFHYAHWLVHRSRILYALVHKIHHISRLPIPADSGTESPAEFALSEVGVTRTLTHQGVQFAIQLFMIGHHHAGHDYFCVTNSTATAMSSAMVGPENVHVLHHSVNTGNYSLPALDRWTRSVIPRKTQGAMDVN